MDYILGAGLLFGAVLTIAFGRLVLHRAAAPDDGESFGAAEAIAFAFTVTLALGVAMMAREAFADASLPGLAKLVGALAAAAAASVAAWIGLARLTTGAAAGRAEAPAGPATPGRGRPRRPSGDGARGGRKAQARRAA